MNKKPTDMKEKGLSSIIGIGITIVVLLIAASIFISSVRSYQSETRSAEEDRNERISDTTQTDLKIENALYDSGNDNIKIKAKNTGSTVLEVSTVQIFLDGKMITNEYISSKLVDGNQTNIWGPTENLSIIIENQSSKPDIVKLVTQYGISDYLNKIGDI